MWDKKLNVNLDILRRLVDSDKLSEEESRIVNNAILFITEVRNESKSFAEKLENCITDDPYHNTQTLINYAKDILRYHYEDVLKYVGDRLVILSKEDFDHLENPGEYILYYCPDIEQIHVLLPQTISGTVTIIIDTNPSLIDKWKKDRIIW